ncbi:hypothetical protein FALBO_9306 [Fusarium albosuccineum]|uniref:Uncharacterized protein n=1 Tax=Fusarium albosuccineum TaxID=1237068 RepID=A0A8H4LA40_9HYPO|nr:hypothetical protein FALBO_9306 [Fusarium albosuccineum]
MSNVSDRDRLVLGIDFGCTYSAAAWALVPAGADCKTIPLKSIKSIANYPCYTQASNSDSMEVEVPTELIYPPSADFRVSDSIHGDAVTEKSLDSDDYENQFRWGYYVHYNMCLAITCSEEKNRHVSRPKLLFDNSPFTRRARKELKGPLKHLKKSGIIENDLQTVVDFLTHFFDHIKNELRDDCKSISGNCQTEIVYCTPTTWSPKGARDMQTCIATALRKVDFPGVNITDNCIENCFLVSEPEAAAAYVLTTKPELKSGETFLLLDAGGGTVDATVYKISQEAPFRLSKEVVKPAGKLCGSSYVNQALREHLLKLLKNEKYLEDEVENIGSIVEVLVVDAFEHKFKRGFDVLDMAQGLRSTFFRVHGLKDNPKKGFRRGKIEIKNSVIQKMFLDCFEGIGKLMEKQLQLAMEAGSQVQVSISDVRRSFMAWSDAVSKHVILVGGFSLSTSLQNFIKGRVNEFNMTHGCDIRALIPSQTNKEAAVNAVAKGAVLRALDKENGPDRLTKSSYGILRHERYMDRPEHRGQRPVPNSLDGEKYVTDLIDWIIHRDTRMDHKWESEAISCRHLFSLDEPELVFREVLYVTDKSHKSHRKATSKKNKGAEVVGEIVADFTFLKEQNIIRPILPKVDANGNILGESRYEIEWKLRFLVRGGNLDCTGIAIYRYYDANRQPQKIEIKCRINLVSCFPQGTQLEADETEEVQDSGDDMTC